MRFSFDEDGPGDRYLLVSFFEQLYIGFEALVDKGVWEASGQPAHLIAGQSMLLAAAWEETKPEFTLIREALDSPDTAVPQDRKAIDDQLRRAGLAGASLRLKLSIIQDWAERAASGLTSAIRKTLENINVLLGSFVQATGMAEIIREFKDIVLNNMSFGEM